MWSAGSAIGQGAGKIVEWDVWKPWDDGEYLWFLMGGAMDPPESVHVSNRKPRDATKSGKFLDGMLLDLRNMQQALIKANLKLYNSISDLQMTKQTAENHLRKFFRLCHEKSVIPVVYYTGHGQTGTGDWCFSDGTISIQDIENMMRQWWTSRQNMYPLLISDACYSGHWANYCLNLYNKSGTEMNCLAAAPEYATAIDTTDNGGEFTKWMTGGPRPRTEPMWSMDNLKDYPITPGYDKVDYMGFISSHIKNTEKVLISQLVVDNAFTGVFGVDNLHKRIRRCWWKCLVYIDLLHYVFGRPLFHNGRLSYINDDDEKKKYIYSLAIDDDFGFGVFCINGYGDDQDMIEDFSSDQTDLRHEITSYWSRNYKITAVGAKDSAFYVVMTRGTKEFDGKTQMWFVRSTWNEVVVGINEGYTNNCPRKILTGICYSRVQQKYLVVMTESNEAQDYKSTTDIDFNRWKEEKLNDGYYPTIVFKANKPGAVPWMVMTTMPDLTECIYRPNYSLK